MSWLASLVITAVMMIEPMTLDHDSNFRCNGNSYGMVDSKGKRLIPEKYAVLEHMGHGIYLAIEPDPNNKFEYKTGGRHFFNRKGKELHVKALGACVLTQVYWFGKEADANPNLMLDSLPPETILKFRLGSKQGLCDTDGNTILLAEHGAIGMPSDAMGSIIYSVNSKRPGYCEIKKFDCVKRELGKVITRTQLREKPNPSHPDVPDVTITCKKWDDGKFNYAYWRQGTEYPVSRNEMFNRFVNENSIIDMSGEELESKLGPADKISMPGDFVYPMSEFFCSPDMQVLIVFRMNNGNVIHWTVADRGSLKK